MKAFFAFLLRLLGFGKPTPPPVTPPVEPPVEPPTDPNEPPVSPVDPPVDPPVPPGDPNEPPVEPSPTYRVCAIIVRDSKGPVVGARVELQGHPEALLTDGNGYAAFQRVDTRLQASHCFITNEGYANWDSHIDLVLRDCDYMAVPENYPVSDTQIRLKPYGERLVQLPTRRTGRVRLDGKCFADDGGAYSALGASLFWAVRGARPSLDPNVVSDIPRLKENLLWLRQRGVDFVRVMGETSDWNENCNTDPRWPDYLTCLRTVRDMCADIGLRIGWCVFGGNKLSQSEQDKCFADVLTVCDERPDVVQYIEISNENNGFSNAAERMRGYCRTAASHGFQTTLTSASHANNIYENSAASFATVHFDRLMGDDGWRPVRQPWGFPGEYGVVPKAFISGEPIGPGASVAQDTDTLRLSQNAVHTWLCGGAAHVVHFGAGIYGIPTQHPTAGPRPANVWEQVALEETLHFIADMRAILPVDVANWQRTRHAMSDHPFSFPPDELRTVGDGALGARQGVVRTYAAYRGGRYVCALIGVMKYVDVTPKHATSWNLINATTGDVIQSGTGAFTVSESNHGRAVIITGTYA